MIVKSTIMFALLGGTDQVYFSTTDQPEHHELFLRANSTKYGFVISFVFITSRNVYSSFSVPSLPPNFTPNKYCLAR